MSNYDQDIFSYITRAEEAYNRPIRLNDAYQWNMKKHLQTSENYNNSQLSDSEKDDWTPVKNITRPILNLQHRAEDIDLKDVQLYIEGDDEFHLSLLVKKYHDDVFVIENDMETFFDELNVSRIDFGGGLSKKLNKPCPEVVPLQSIAFCNQKDLVNNPIGLLHEFSPDQLLEMRKFGWGDRANGATHSIEELIAIWHEQEVSEDGIKIYEVHGNLPKRFSSTEYSDSVEYETRIYIVSMLQAKDGGKKGIILYSALENENPFDLVKRDPVYGRALGFGGAEEIFEEQVWTNYDQIRIQKMLDAAASTVIITTDPTLAARHPKGLKNLKPLEIIEATQGTETRQLDTFPRNMQLFDNHAKELETQARTMGAAQDPVLGVAPTSGTPFASLQAQIQQGMGLHDYRRKQYAKHIINLYQRHIIPHIKKQITKDQNFLASLSQDEMTYVADRMVVHEWNKYFAEKTLNGGEFQEGEMEQWMSDWKDNFKKEGSQKFIKILKGELKAAKIKVSIAGVSKDLAAAADKITKIFQFMFSNPDGFIQIMQIPGVAKNFNTLMEYSGMQPSDFAGIEKYKSPAMQQSAQIPAPK